MRKTVSWIGHRVRESLVHLDRLRQPAQRRRICFLPWGRPEGDSTELRVVNIARALRANGWRCVIIPSQLELAQRQRVIRFENPDVIFMQKSRHPANRPAFYKDYPVVYDIDDADFLDERLTEAVAECCRGSKAVIAGSHFVAQWCRQFNANVQIVWTGTPLPRTKPARNEHRAPIIAWAASAAQHQVADQQIVAETLVELAARRRDLNFRCYGVDDMSKIAPFLDKLVAAGVTVTTYPRMPYKRFLHSLEEVAVGLAPFSLDIPFNQGKSFGKVLAYLVADVAVVASPVVEHPRFFRHGENGMLPPSLADWVDSVDGLLADPSQRQVIVDNAREDFSRDLTTNVAASKVAHVLESVLV
jgi:glycosyltransferase involved in cell wall biosynthesis